jgi:peptidoglycan/LPS O-acetylase OafA/YrhL
MTRKEGLRLEYLDGLRAAASLYVLLFHAGLGFSPRELPGWGRAMQRCLCFGHDAVAVFIVLSGYCLMLPVARAEGRMLRGTSSYFARRAWRILPPYYATLLATLLTLAALPGLAAPSKTIWDDTWPAFAAGPVVTHLLLIHNWFPAWVHTINGPLWSVATEWQIYFFFPWLLLPIWNRFGALPTVLMAFVLGYSCIWFAPRAADTVNTWYLGLFAVGMCAAGINFAGRPAETVLRERGGWGYASSLLLLLVAAGTTVGVHVWFQFIPISDALVGVTTACSLVYLTQRALRPATETRPLVLRVLESAPLVGLGRFSYSLYLTHLPIIALCFFGLRRFGLTPGTELFALLALSLPLSLAFSYAFYWVFERRFVGAPPALFSKRTA